MNNISLPSFTDKDLQDAKERKKILDALYALHEAIQRQSGSIDESSFSAAYLAKVQAMQEAAQQYPVIREQVMTDRKAALAEIKAKAEEIRTTYSAEINNTNLELESIKARQDEYITADGTLTQTAQSQISQTASSVFVEFKDQVESDIANISNFNDIITRFTFDDDGLGINRNTSAIYMLLSNDKMLFNVNGSAVPLATFSATDGLDTPKVTTGDVVASGNVDADTMTVDTSVTVGSFKWIDEGDLGFSLVFTGG